MVPKSTKPGERPPLGEDRAATLRKPGIPLALLDLHSWPGSLEFAVPARKCGAAGHECAKEREELAAGDGVPIAHSVATIPPAAAEPAAPASLDGPRNGSNAPLREIIQAWPKLPGPIQTAITTIVRAAMDAPTV